MAPKTRQYAVYLFSLALMAISLPLLYHHIHKDMVFYRQGKQALANREYTRAADLFAQANQAGLNSRRLFHSMAETNMRLGRWSAAETAYRHLVQRQPDALQPKLELARIQYIRGNYSQAEQKVRLILEHKPGWSPALYLLGKIYTAQGNFGAAIKVYHNILGEKG